MEYGTNIWLDLDSEADRIDDAALGKRLFRPPGATLAAAVWELEPSGGVDYHFHHGTEELLLVLRGRLTLRTPDGERELAEGEVVHFPRGLEGAHGIVNRSDAAARYVMVAAHGTPDVIEYPDRGTLAVMARTASEDGEPLFARFRRADARAE
jgi:uncharacterized cupin superfamily protein